MSQFAFEKNDLPFLLSGAGKLFVDPGDLDPTQSLDQAASTLFKLSFDAAGDRKLALGRSDTVKVGLTASSATTLTAVSASAQGASADLLAANGLEQFFADPSNAGKVVLAFNAGASAQLAASGSFKYSALNAGVELDSGADAGYSYLRAFDKDQPIGNALPAFFSTMRLPEQAHAGINHGESISLRYGGYLHIAAEASAGYRLAGTKSVSLGEMALSEKYDLSILGKIGLRAQIAGHFAIIVSGVAEPAGWARVRVHRRKSKSIGIAADVNAGLKNELHDLPPTANEFLGAALGVNAKNFLNLFAKARELSDFAAFKTATDGLAQRFVAEYVKKGFDQLEKSTEFDSFLTRVNRVVESYSRVGDRAVTLVDRFFNQRPELTEFLTRLRDLNAAGLDTLRQQLNPVAWNILAQLTDGDPLAFLLGQVSIGGKKLDALRELQDRATAVLDLLNAPAHEELLALIDLAKQSFGIDRMFAELAKIDSVDELRAVASEKAGQFVSRLVGRTLDSSGNLKQAFREVRAVLDKLDTFKDKLFAAFKEAVNGSYSIALHAEYSRASETDALVDVLINLTQPAGSGLLAQAGKGDFEEVLATSDTNLVRLREGVFTHRTRRESAFKVNITGWHHNYRYEGFDRVITETEQRLVPSSQGIIVNTTADLRLERQRKRQNEQTHLNFLLRALGESAKAVKSDAKNTAYFIDTLSSLTARYELNFTDEDTSAGELQDYLAFAGELGLDRRGATLAMLDPLLPRAGNGGFGNVEAAYDVRFGEKAVTALLQVRELTAHAELHVRNAMRRMVLSNYLKSDEMHDVAFAYATPGIFDLFSGEGPSEFSNHFERHFFVRLLDSSVAAPAAVRLDRMELHVLSTLYNIENDMIRAIKELIGVLHGGASIDPRAFEKKMEKFGSVLKTFDSFDQTSNKHGTGTNTIFAMFDLLIRLASPQEPVNIALLRLKSRANGETVEKIFFSDEAAG